MTRRWDRAFALALAVVFAVAAYLALSWSEIARLFPLAVAVPGLILALLAIVLPARTEPAEPDEEELPRRELVRRTALTIAWILGFFAAVYLLGFLISIPLGAVAYMRVIGSERWTTTSAVAAGCWAFIYALFDRLLHVPLPRGELVRLFFPDL